MTIEVTGRRYYDAQGRVLNFPVGNTGDIMRCEHDLHVTFKVELGNVLIKKVDDQFEMIGGEWWDYGFVAGDTIEINMVSIDGTTGIDTTDIDFIDGSTMYVIAGGVAAGMQTYNAGYIITNKNPESFETYFNLVRNTQTGSEASLIDGQVQRFQAGDMSGLTEGSSLPMLQLGNRSGGSKMEVEITRNTDPAEGRQYTVSVLFMWWNLNQPELFDANNCVTPWLKFIALPQYNNPAISLEKAYKPTGEGNSGFRNENYNGGDSEYIFDSITWEVAGSPAQTQDYTKPSKFIAIINSENGLFTSNSKFNIGWFYDTTDEDVYKSKPSAPIATPIENNLMVLTGAGTLSVGSSPSILGNTNSAGAGLTLGSITISQTGTSATITGTLTPNADFIQYMTDREGDRGFRLWVKCDQDDSEEAELNYSLMVNVEVASGQMEKAAVILGEWDDIEDVFALDHFDEEIIAPVITEDDILNVVLFRLPLDTPFVGITAKVVAKNGLQFFSLDEVVIPFLPYPILPDGTIPVNYQVARPFKLPPSSNKRLAKLVRNTSIDDTGVYGLELNYPVLIRWEYWQSQLNASNVFYGTTGEGKNKDWEHYQALGWSLQLLFEVNTSEGSYQNFYPITVLPYDSDSDVTTTIEFFRQDDTPTTMPIQGEVMKVKVTHDFPTDPDFEWGQFRAYPFEGAPAWLISTFLDAGNDSSNPLFPLEGETKIKVTEILNTVVYEFQFDTSKIDTSAGVSFTSEIKAGKDADVGYFNRHKATYKVAVLPQPFVPQDRGLGGCCPCEPALKLASATNTGRYYNDLTGAVVKLSDVSDTIEFVLVRNGEEIDPIGVECLFNNGQNVKAFVINWREHLIANGAGCYHLNVNYNIAGISGSYEYGEYTLLPWSIENAAYTVRIYSIFDDLNRKLQIDFTGSGFVDSIRVRGEFGQMQPNEEISNLVSAEYIRNKVRNQALKTYELNVDPVSECVISEIVDNHLLGANMIYICDHNATNPSYKYNDFPVIRKQGTTSELTYEKGSRLIGLKTIFEDKGAFDEAHFAGSLKIGQNAGFILSQGGSLDSSVDAVAVNSEGTVLATETVTPDSPQILIPDDQLKIYYYGVLQETINFPALSEVIININ